MSEPMSKRAKIEDPSGDLPESAKAILKEIDDIQSQLDTLSEKASEEIIKVEQKYNLQRKPHMEKRSKLIKDLPNFWPTVFLNHPQIANLINELEEKALESLTSVEVEESEDIKSGYKHLDDDEAESGLTFFQWLCTELEPGVDDIAEVIKDDIWPNPLQYFLVSEMEDLTDDDLDEADDDDDLEEVDEDYEA
ncbi:unnamed protein product, partial [Mesorhabditis belari]|uniref:Uncharacterized protein n=1 Tax=Mesorhabditis belari TaxID=2138241 RepID=A0AAF3FES0_9BILA